MRAPTWIRPLRLDRDTIRGRIRLAALAVLTLLVLAGGLGWWSTRRLSTTISRTLESYRAEASLTSRFATTIAQELHAAGGLLLERDSAAAARFHRLRTDTRRLYLQLDRDVEHTVAEAEVIARIEGQLARIEVHYATAHRLGDLGRHTEAREEAARTVPIVRSMLEDVEALQEMQAAKIAKLSAYLQEESRQQALFLIGVIGLGIATASLARRYAERNISRPLERLAWHARRLGEGDLEVRTPTGALPGEIQVLATTMNQVGDSLGRLAAAETALRQTEKMAALGRVTAGIAHEINSPLGGILNALQLAKRYAEEYRDSAADPEVSSEDHRAIATDLLGALEIARGATHKVGRFVRTIREQTRTGEEETRPFSLSREVESTVALLQQGARDTGVRIDCEVEPGLEIVGSPEKLCSIVQNLVTNAVDAYEEKGGVVRVRASARGDEVVLEVEDEGCGIPEEIRGRIFDYLFTTKDVGKGTGLGLSIVHSLVTGPFAGEIDVDSAPGRGTTFVVTLPRARNAAPVVLAG